MTEVVYTCADNCGVRMRAVFDKEDPNTPAKFDCPDCESWVVKPGADVTDSRWDDDWESIESRRRS